MSSRFMRKQKRARIKSGQTVIVISGKEKGNIGKVLSVDWKNERVLIEGLNFVTKHVKSSSGVNESGLIRSEASIHYSNIQLYNPDLGCGVRTRMQINEIGEKQLICTKTSSVLN